MPRRISVVILNWNGASDTIGCINSLAQDATCGRIRIVIVDNASTDQSLPTIRDFLRNSKLSWLEVASTEVETSAPPSDVDVVLVRSERNGGYAAGNNHGIRLSLRMEDVDYVWLLNNDTTVAPGSINELLRAADNNQTVAAWGSTLIENSGTLRIAGGARYFPLLTISKRIMLSSGNNATVAPRLDYISGAAMLLSKRAIKAVGLLNEDYFLFFEELDYTHRLRQAGFKIDWCAASVVHHSHGASAGSRSEVNPVKSPLAEYHCNLSCLIFTRKFYPLIFPLAAAFRLLSKFLLLALRRELKGIQPVVAAYRHYFSKSETVRMANG